MSLAPALSVVVVTHESEARVSRFLASVPNACGDRAYETLVVDTASKDGSLSVAARSAPAARILALPANLGYGAALNAGARLASGNWLAFCNADVTLDCGCLAQLVSALEPDPGAAGAGPVLRDSNGCEAPCVRVFPSLRQELLEMLLVHRAWPGNPMRRRVWRTDLGRETSGRCDFVAGAAFVVPRRVFEQVGFFDEGFFLYYEETDWFRRAADLGFHALLVAEAGAVHEGGGSSEARMDLLDVLLSSQHRYFRKHGGAACVMALGGIQAAGLLLRQAVWSARLLAGAGSSEGLSSRLARNRAHASWLAARMICSPRR